MDNIINNLPNEIHKEITDKDGIKINFDIDNINKLKDIYNDLTTTKYEQSKEKYMIDKKKFNIKSIIIFCCLVISLILMFVSVFIDEMLFIAGSVLIILITLFGFINNKNPKNSYNFMYKSCQKYYESNMDEKDINEIYRLEHLFPILQEISDLETDKPIKIHANSRGIDILYIDKNKYPKTIEIIPYVDLQIASIDFKDIKNIEITNKDFSIINITLPLKYSDTYKELTY
ncbi:hypothetical protein [Agathobacter rectalis]|uniref:hypothetical protein n=1 Tax=Agathobacter rectalis TaxID=39491 RepID=UPI0027D21015|nr:hypothetical protein [Agathobacter rectalis]MCB7108356.1 hypothetical protein [Agathobacter rectalis]MCG4811765.1 hypothetical protein [Agathobacter rectalis]